MSTWLSPLSPADLPAFTAIYESSFPEAERKPLPFMMQGPLAPAYNLLVIRTDDTPVAGLAVTVCLSDYVTDYVMLDYLAISPTLRGRGIGHEVLPLIKEYCASTHRDAHLFLEIETPPSDGHSCSPDCPNPTQRVRRKAFYLSAGLVETGVHAFLYGSHIELLAYPKDAPYITLEAYRNLLRATCPATMQIKE